MLHAYVDEAARVRPEHPAVVEAGGEISWRELAELSDRVRDRLAAEGVRRGDRVGLCVRKSIDTVAGILGALKCGAAYVPVDPTAPAERNAFILADCAVKALLADARLVPGLCAELEKHGARPALLALEGPGGGAGLRRCLAERTAPPAATVASEPGDLAYILYTSGSTGKPKGVMLSHENAVAFVEWCWEVLAPRPDDRFSSHAPFHFDLSILDLYVPMKRAATLVLVSEEVGKEPLRLAELIADSGISVWYSAPSILGFLVQYGKLEQRDLGSLRIVIFAGEVFPLVHLKALKQQLPRPRYLNLYGPTETNVCTWYELPPEIGARGEPFPIGKVCGHLEGVVVDPEGRPVAGDGEGELCIRGPNVMQGYWGRPELTEKAFLRVGDGAPYYRTGDLVAPEADGNLRFLGRRDRMVKKRGYRVELGEIEACLYRHPSVAEAAVVALQDDADGVRIHAHLAGRSGERPSLIALKRFCAEHLPLYMVPDVFAFHAALPKTTTDKIDYQRLKALG
jgi:amino acid adenylation domain-containing protein